MIPVFKKYQYAFGDDTIASEIPLQLPPMKAFRLQGALLRLERLPLPEYHRNRICYEAGCLTIPLAGGRSAVIDPNRGIALDTRATVPAEHLDKLIQGMFLPLLFMLRGGLALHASSIEIQGSTILLAGPPRAGKSTLTSYAGLYGGKILAEDTSLLGLSNHSVQAYPGATTINLRHETYGYLQATNAEKLSWQTYRDGNAELGDTAGEQRYRLCSGLPVINEARSLKAAYRIVTGRSLAIRKLDSLEAAGAIISVVKHDEISLNQLPAEILPRIAKFIERIPVFELERSTDITALPQLFKKLEAHATQLSRVDTVLATLE